MLYTMILDYRGGTYVSQVRSNSPITAVKKWAKRVSASDLNIWGLDRSDLGPLSTDDPVPLKNCQNVWCSSASARKKLLLLNIIGTDNLIRHRRPPKDKKKQ
jgi:hypothetical protein